ncbi:hypothetical protein [Paenibacillus methanolicus]|uniref:Uncharacterized protein n=1 Tax=Paenibacillus methanolicus TaxID=582686 RepID=A0A5S5BQF3_9BACL|nr:hypothetical protein [Paenibacillus methanolicus]TYP68372.1 hypothetical protein BCM02_11957 [Paenibacillus methanolicus]
MRTIIAIHDQLQQAFNRMEKEPRLPAVRPSIRSYPHRGRFARSARLHVRRRLHARRREQWPFELPGSRRFSIPA